MKLSAVAFVAASAAVVSASPLRVVVVSNVNAVAEPNPFAKVRFGHAVPNPNVAQLFEGPPGRAQDARPSLTRPRPCGMRGGAGGRWRQKAIEIQNAFRKTFGLPLIEPAFNPHASAVIPVHGGAKEIHGGMVHIMPMPFIGTEPANGGDKGFHGWFAAGDDKNARPINIFGGPGGPHHPPPPPPPHHGHHGHHGHHHGTMRFHQDEGFLLRLQNALMSLGPWEGRAVAFVVGAGIGVLIRMIWVFGLVAYRGCSNDREYSAIDTDDLEDDDNETFDDRRRRTPISAPPSYVYPVDEKVRIEEAVVVVKTDVVDTPPAPAPAAENN